MSALLVNPVYISGMVMNAPVIAVYRFGIYGFTLFLQSDLSGSLFLIGVRNSIIIFKYIKKVLSTDI